LSSKKSLTYKRNGTFARKGFTSFTSYSSVILQLTDAFHREIEIRLSMPDKRQTITEKSFVFQGDVGIAITDIPAGDIKEISIKGLKKNESVTISEPPLDFIDPTCVVPFWAGIASEHQVNTFFKQKLPFIQDIFSNNQYSSLYKIMLLEFLMSQGKITETLRLLDIFYNIFGGPQDSQVEEARSTLQNLDDLIPTKLLLTLCGIQKWTKNEIILEIDDAPLPPITVQYGKTTVEFLQGLRKITHANGETVILNQPGKIKIMTA